MGFILYDQTKPNTTLAWLGRMWVGLAALFSATCYSLWQQNSLWYHWPMIIVGNGLMFLLVGILPKFRAFRIPGILLSGLGAILMTQWITHNWQSWSYVWALIPALIGAGIFSASSGKSKSSTAGIIIFGISIMFFLIFATVFSGLWHIFRYWPVLFILLGIWFLRKELIKEDKGIFDFFKVKKEALE